MRFGFYFESQKFLTRLTLIKNLSNKELMAVDNRVKNDKCEIGIKLNKNEISCIHNIYKAINDGNIYYYINNTETKTESRLLFNYDGRIPIVIVRKNKHYYQLLNRRFISFYKKVNGTKKDKTNILEPGKRLFSIYREVKNKLYLLVSPLLIDCLDTNYINKDIDKYKGLRKYEIRFFDYLYLNTRFNKNSFDIKNFHYFIGKSTHIRSIREIISDIANWCNIGIDRGLITKYTICNSKLIIKRPS